MERIKKILLVCLLLPLSAVALPKSKQGDVDVKRLIESKRFTFSAQTATPMGGGMVQLNAMYFITVDDKVINSYLPYFGRAFTAEIGRSASPLDFSTSQFTYSYRARRKGAYSVTISFSGPELPTRATLSVSATGYGTLNVASINRQPISFYGFISPVRGER